MTLGGVGVLFADAQFLPPWERERSIQAPQLAELCAETGGLDGAGVLSSRLRPLPKVGPYVVIRWYKDKSGIPVACWDTDSYFRDRETAEAHAPTDGTDYDIVNLDAKLDPRARCLRGITDNEIWALRRASAQACEGEEWERRSRHGRKGSEGSVTARSQL